MESVFLRLVNMSISASWLILAVLALRLAGRRLPKWISVLLWGLVGLRLVLPFSVESAYSLVPSAQTLFPSVMYSRGPVIESGIDAVDRLVNPAFSQSFAPSPADSANPLQFWLFLGGVLWAAGMGVLLLYGLISSLRLRRRVREAIPAGGNILLCDRVSTPFILGVLSPKIYLPSGLTEAETGYVLAHEWAHLKRGDHIWKVLGFLVLILHWFNPLVWLAYVLLCRDMEGACDEKAVRDMDLMEKKAYASALVSCSMRRKMVMTCPLAFGEIGVKERVKNVLRYKKPALWVIAAALLVCAVLALCFLTNPKQSDFDIRIVVPAGAAEGYYYSDEEVSSLRGSITISAAQNARELPGGGNVFMLLPTEIHGTAESSDIPVYESAKRPVTFPIRWETGRDNWFRVGIKTENPTDTDILVYVRVKGVKVRIATASSSYPTELEM